MVAQVEETFPDLPQLVQAALNSSHTAAQEQAEMEIMATKGPQSIPHNVHRWMAMRLVAQVEETAALNSSHIAAHEQREMEIMASMASQYAHTKNLKEAMQLAGSP